MNDVASTEWQGRSAICQISIASDRKKVVGELDAGKPHVQFDEGAQETCKTCNAPVLYSTAQRANPLPPIPIGP